MDSWLLDILACPQPGCGGALASADNAPTHTGLIRCLRCDARYPVLARVPILVPYPARWVAAHRDPILAALAEVGQASLQAVAVVDAFASAAGPVSQGRTVFEPSQRSPERSTVSPPPEGTRAASLFADFLGEALQSGEDRSLTDMLAGRLLGQCLQLGSASEQLCSWLRASATHVVFADLSLRRVFRTLEAASGPGQAAYEGVVLDPEHLGLAPQGLQTMVIAELTHRLADPIALLAGTRRALKSGGALAMTTRDPSMGIGDSDNQRLDQLIEEAGFGVRDMADGIPSLRCHDGRHFEIRFMRAVLGVG